MERWNKGMRLEEKIHGARRKIVVFKIGKNFIFFISFCDPVENGTCAKLYYLGENECYWICIGQSYVKWVISAEKPGTECTFPSEFRLLSTNWKWRRFLSRHWNGFVNDNIRIGVGTGLGGIPHTTGIVWTKEGRVKDFLSTLTGPQKLLHFSFCGGSILTSFV